MIPIRIFIAALSSGLAVQAAALSGERAAAASRHDPRAANATVGSMVWKGRIVKDGPEVHLTGTSAQDIHAQIMAINPSYEPEHPIGATSAVPLPLSARDGGKSVFERQGATVSCHGIEKGLDSEIRGAIHYLSNLGGWCGSTEGGCARMTCSQDTATYFCSENGDYAYLACSDVAVVLNYIMYVCSWCVNGITFGNYYSGDYSIWAGLGRCWQGGNDRPTNYPEGTQPNHGTCIRP